MTAIAHGRQLASDNQDFTADTVWHTVLTAAASNFVAGGKYLLIVQIASLGGTSTTNKVGARVCHGTTPTSFTSSEWFAENHASQSARGSLYRWFTVFTQPGTAEDIVLQVNNNNAQTVTTRGARLIQWIRLDDDLTENTDWFYAENNTTDDCSATEETRASISLDPPAAGDDWLILGVHRYNNNGAGSAGIHRRITQDPAGTPVQLGGTDFFRPKDPDDNTLAMMAHVVENHGDAAVTYAVQDRLAADGVQQHLNSAIFALNLDKFAQHNFAHDADAITATLDTWTDVTPDGWVDPTVATAGDWFVLAVMRHNFANAANRGRMRIQIDGVDEPTGWDVGSDGSLSGSQANQQYLGVVTGMPNLATGARSIDLDANNAHIIGGPTWSHRTLIAWSMELAAAGATQEAVGQGAASATGTATGALAKPAAAQGAANPSGQVAAATVRAGAAVGAASPQGSGSIRTVSSVAAEGSASPQGAAAGRGVHVSTAVGSVSPSSLAVVANVARASAVGRASPAGFAAARAVTSVVGVGSASAQGAAVPVFAELVAVGSASFQGSAVVRVVLSVEAVGTFSISSAGVAAIWVYVPIPPLDGSLVDAGASGTLSDAGRRGELVDAGRGGRLG